MEFYELDCRYDARQSFYGKAKVVVDKGCKTLYSYDTKVAQINRKGELKLFPYWDYSQTTMRHVKEFMRQNGFRVDTVAQIRKEYIK